MAKQRGVFLRERLAVGCKQGADTIGQAGMIPDESLRKCRQTGLVKHRVGINAATLPALIAEDTLFGIADTDRIGIAVVGRNENIETEFVEGIEEAGKESFLGPGADLSGHADSTEFHAVHDFINFEKRYAQHASL